MEKRGNRNVLEETDDKGQEGERAGREDANAQFVCAEEDEEEGGWGGGVVGGGGGARSEYLKTFWDLQAK